MVMFSQLSNGQLIDLNGYWKFAIGDQRNWSNKNFDDSKWDEIRVPRPWEDQGYHGFDGFAWYRNKFDGTKLDKDQSFYLNLGYIDDVDEVYINGELIGFSGSMPPQFKTAFNSERKYVIPKYLIDYNGSNTIAVRVYDVTQAGGIVDGDVGIYSVSSVTPMYLDLRGVWDFAISRNGSKPSADTEWDRILVPSHWEAQGYRRYDGYAWYKKTFTLTKEMYEDELVLILGKIDDFDEVYINGKLAGQTRDNRRVGSSTSYSKYRVYYIPKVLLKSTGQNLIEVLVEDIGIDGGIYSGPVGITTKKSFDKMSNQFDW